MKTIGAFIRVGPNEETTIIECLNSIKDLFDVYYIGYADNVEEHVRYLLEEYVKEHNKLTYEKYKLIYYPFKLKLLKENKMRNDAYPIELHHSTYANHILKYVTTDLIVKIDVDQVYIKNTLQEVINDAKNNLKENEYIVFVGYNTAIINNELKQLTVYPINGLFEDTILIHSKDYGPFKMTGYFEYTKPPIHFACKYYTKPLWYHHAKKWHDGNDSNYIEITNDMKENVHYTNLSVEMIEEYKNLMKDNK